MPYFISFVILFYNLYGSICIVFSYNNNKTYAHIKNMIHLI